MMPQTEPALRYRDHNFLGMTQSLCPDCLSVVPAKIVTRGRRVYFRKSCRTHGTREDFVCSDIDWFDLTEYSLPGKLPKQFGTDAQHGCPYDCGLCDEHEQHTCIGLLEITSACNLECPMCFAVSGPGKQHLTFEECRSAIDRLIETEGQAEILQLSGGEPTIHPEFADILEYACNRPIDIVMVNTNGIRIAKDPAFVELLASWKHRCEVYLQFDGFDDERILVLRDENLLELKMRAVEALEAAGIRTILVSTVHPGVNEDQLGRITQFGVSRSNITGVSFQPATYSGRYVLPEVLEQRITFPDVIRGIASQTDGEWRESDFSPLPCAHPNGHSLAYAFRCDGEVLPVARFLKVSEHLDLLSGRITFNRRRASDLIREYLARQPCGAGGCDCGPPESDRHESTIESPGQAEPFRDALPDASDNADLSLTQLAAAAQFLQKALSEELDPEDMFRITTTSFMDAWNFDLRQLMKSCVHHLLPSGHVIPFSAYNVLYRPGHVPLPELRDLRTAAPVC